jgi:heme peroxidase
MGSPAPAIRDHCLAPERTGASVYGGRYRRLLPGLPSLENEDAALHTLGGPGGICAADEDCPDGAEAAGWPFFGQFVAHDITADRSPLGHRSDPAQVVNFRTPRANLEGVYGAGPVGSPYLYEKADPAKLLVGPGGFDLPRNHEGMALTGDPRNDVHLFMSQMQLGFIGLHNRLVDRMREDGVKEAALFDEARRAATWHYQHVILREFLPLLIGGDLTDELLRGGSRFYDPGEDPYIPFEFADAAYRYGHSQIRNAYEVNEGFGPVPVFPDLIGFGAVAEEHAVEWPRMFDLPGAPPAQRAKRIDGSLPASLIALPREITGEDETSDYASLATRDLQRGQATGLPSGEAVAEAFGAPVLDADQLGLAAGGWEGETPLWLYILRESDALCNGDRLGPVGGRIVGEVLLGIIDADPESFRSVQPTWEPTLPSHDGSFGLIDLLVPA